ncbi:hypothetical protein [Pectobacterium versatile]|uniref:hypothetical protein n=1 Tax=Pectobacterium versatile TaxID=2488639 RepID=UPI001F28F6CB|nr:hypothetical protein [Pectobacterium versatile]
MGKIIVDSGHLSELEFIRESSCEVMQEFADELGCKPDNEVILQAIDALKSKVAELEKQRDALVAESAALKNERLPLIKIGELIRTQDNRITDQPFFAVMVKSEIVTSEDHDYDRICWVENQSGDYAEASETQHRRLEAIYQGKCEVRYGWDRYHMKEVDVFATGCFTEQGCKDYISRNGHNLNKPFIFAFGSYRNNEYQAVRKFIMEMKETPATDAAIAEIGAKAVEQAAMGFHEKCYAAFEGSDEYGLYIRAELMQVANKLRGGGCE